MQKTSQQVTNTFSKDYKTYFKKCKNEEQRFITELPFLNRTKLYDARTIDNWLAEAKQKSCKVEIDKTDSDNSGRVSTFTVYISLKYNDIDGSSLTISRIAFFGCHEKKAILETSDSLEYQRITQLATAKLNELDPINPIPDLLNWIYSYHDLTSKPCKICDRLLNYDSFNYKYLPPIVRLQEINNKKNFLSYHWKCYKNSTIY
ncbi:hypothetical protein RhiirC2_574133 [Rhizophagus irregularis]|uniref:Uncharacterized protein n=1 Tax=Rhizophagus irregularis TaxID=588596 RepID=A0A2N1N074_9GLOM|nr:hypothetical protein RhiirC2_574133 [Rhizophagus irregularis]